MKILLAEDTADLNRVICAMLEHEGYEVDTVFDGEAATAKINENGYDCIILDIMMPKKDGIAVLTDARAMKVTTPVLMLTAKAEVDDRVAGLDAGADDYLAKPFAMKELMARVRAMTRGKHEYAVTAHSYRDFTLDAETLSLSCENSIRLSLKEFELMQLFTEHAGVALSEDFILTHVWHDDDEAGSDTVWLYCSYLKRKLMTIQSEAVIEGDRGGEYVLN